MNDKLEIIAEVKKDIVVAAAWYREKSDGLDERFLEQLQIIFTAILQNPKTFKRVYKNFRQAALKKFPYVIVYETEAEKVIIYSVFHASQHPRKKIRRLKQ